MDKQGWHLKNWHFLGWLETVIKTAAIIIGIYVFFLGVKEPNFLPIDNVPFIQLIILIILSLGLVAAIYNRYQNKDIVSMVFVLFNNWGHWGLIYGIFKGVEARFLYSFAMIMLAGDLIKIIFLRKYNYSEGELAPKKFIYLTSVYIIGYILIILLGLPTLL